MKKTLMLFALAGSLALAGCGERKPVGSQPAQSTSGQAAPTLSAGDASALGIKTPEGEADVAWQSLEKTFEGLMSEPPGQPENPTREQTAQLQKDQARKLSAAADQAREFHTKFPNHANAAEAKAHEQGLLSVAARLGDTNAAAKIAKLEQSRLDDPNLPEEERLQLRVQRLQREASARADGKIDVMLSEMEKGVRELQKEFPKRSELGGLLLQIAEAHASSGSPEKARAIGKDILESKPEADLKEAADELIAKLDRVGKPLNIKFKAIDDREVDLAGMKGKVVLVDFWATWCGPCMAELPNVKAAYEKLHDRGFEIVGISFDRDIEKLKQVVAREKMAWPQYFESGGNKFGEEFGISGIPAMWLVDKKGLLRDLNGRENLSEKVEKLLAEH